MTIDKHHRGRVVTATIVRGGEDSNAARRLTEVNAQLLRLVRTNDVRAASVLEKNVERLRSKHLPSEYEKIEGKKINSTWKHSRNTKIVSIEAYLKTLFTLVNRINRTLMFGPRESLQPNPQESRVESSASSSLGHTSVHRRSKARQLSLSRSIPSR